MNDDENSDSNAIAPEEGAQPSNKNPPGVWTKGMASPNKAGRPRTPKNIAELRELAREKSGAALDFLARTVSNPKCNFNVRVTAAIEILNRGYGRAPQSLDVNHGTQDSLAQLLEQISGRFPIKTVEGTIIRPALEAKQPLHDLGQGREEDSVPPKLGTTETPE